MDDSQFDDVVRSFHHRAKTRRILLASGVAGVVLGSTSLPDADARKKKKKHKHKKKPRPVCKFLKDCGANCRCFLDVDDVLGCYDLGTQGVCCDSAAECGPNQGCVFSACEAGGKAGGCFSFCAT
jgi:hypothetical protein